MGTMSACGVFDSNCTAFVALSRLLMLMLGLVLLAANSLFWFKAYCDNKPDFPAVLKAVRGHSTTNSSYGLAFRESLGFFDDIHETSWRLYRENFHSESVFMQPKVSDARTDTATAVWMFNNVDPMFTCPHARRVGGRGDGPKWVCDPHRLRTLNDCLVYSIGSAGNFMFEDGLNDIVGSKHCEIHVFDPETRFARPNDADTKNIHYHAWGIKSSYSDPTASGRDFITLSEVQQRLGHSGRRIDIFKIDCEGCEWTTYKNWVNESIDVRQILIEAHASKHRPDDVTLSRFFQTFLKHGFVPFAKEPNTRPAARPAGTMFEYAFVKLAPSFFDKESASSS